MERQSSNRSSRDETILERLTEVLSARASDDNKLPNMKLLEFNGDYDKFIPYWDTFHSMVDSKKILNVQKLNHLVNTLKGPAASFIAGYQMTGDNYELIVDKLKQKYGQRRVVVSKILRALLFRPQCTSMKQVRETVDFLQASVRQLDREQIRHEDPALQLVLLSVLEVKLPSEMLLKWTEYVTREEVKLNLEAPRLPKAVACAPLRNHITVKQFLAWCESKLLSQELSTATQCESGPAATRGGDSGSSNQQTPAKRRGRTPASTPKQQNPPQPTPKAPRKKRAGKRTPQTQALVSHGGGKGGGGGGKPPQQQHRGKEPQKQQQRSTLECHKTGCIWDGGNHPTKGCNKAAKMDYRERWQRIRDRIRVEPNKMICFKCFGDHKADDCSAPNCSKCDKRHHLSLHKESTAT